MERRKSDATCLWLDTNPLLIQFQHQAPWSPNS